MPETPDIALREVLEAAFETNAKLCREHETKLLEVKQREQEATDRATQLQNELRDAANLHSQLQQELQRTQAENVSSKKELEAARSGADLSETELQAALARVRDLEKEIDSMCEVRLNKPLLLLSLTVATIPLNMPSIQN